MTDEAPRPVHMLGIDRRSLCGLDHQRDAFAYVERPPLVTCETCRARVMNPEVHLIWSGAALCGKPGVPGEWGPGQAWLSLADFDDMGEQVTCAGCLVAQAHPELRDTPPDKRASAVITYLRGRAEAFRADVRHELRFIGAELIVTLDMGRPGDERGLVWPAVAKPQPPRVVFDIESPTVAELAAKAMQPLVNEIAGKVYGVTMAEATPAAVDVMQRGVYVDPDGNERVLFTGGTSVPSDERTPVRSALLTPATELALLEAVFAWRAQGTLTRWKTEPSRTLAKLVKGRLAEELPPDTLEHLEKQARERVAEDALTRRYAIQEGKGRARELQALFENLGEIAERLALVVEEEHFAADEQLNWQGQPGVPPGIPPRPKLPTGGEARAAALVEQALAGRGRHDVRLVVDYLSRRTPDQVAEEMLQRKGEA